jgi:hypothetical protein
MLRRENGVIVASLFPSALLLRRPLDRFCYLECNEHATRFAQSER